MLTSPVAAARAAVATGAWVKSKHDVYLIRGSVGALSFLFTHPPEDLKKKEKKGTKHAITTAVTHHSITKVNLCCDGL